MIVLAVFTYEAQVVLAIAPFRTKGDVTRLTFNINI
jgi:hypothetical protein